MDLPVSPGEAPADDLSSRRGEATPWFLRAMARPLRLRTRMHRERGGARGRDGRRDRKQPEPKASRANSAASGGNRGGRRCGGGDVERAGWEKWPPERAGEAQPEGRDSLLLVKVRGGGAASRTFLGSAGAGPRRGPEIGRGEHGVAGGAGLRLLKLAGGGGATSTVGFGRVDRLREMESRIESRLIRQISQPRERSAGFSGGIVLVGTK